MKSASWLLQVYEMSDLAAHKSAADLLSGVRGLTVDARTCERGAFLTIECADASQALAVYEMVLMADSEAELIHSTTGDTKSEPGRATESITSAGH